MVYEGVLEGRYVDLRSVIEDDAKFTLSLRQDPLLTQYLLNLISQKNSNENGFVINEFWKAITFL